MNGIFDAQMVGFTFLVFLLLISVFFYFVNRRIRVRHSDGKVKPYMCGEEKRDAAAPHMGFYKTVVAGMKFRKLRRIQSGDVSDYVIAAIAGTVLMMILLVVSLG